MRSFLGEGQSATSYTRSKKIGRRGGRRAGRAQRVRERRKRRRKQQQQQRRRSDDRLRRKRVSANEKMRCKNERMAVRDQLEHRLFASHILAASRFDLVLFFLSMLAIFRNMLVKKNENRAMPQTVLLVQPDQLLRRVPHVVRRGTG